MQLQCWRGLVRLAKLACRRRSTRLLGDCEVGFGWPQHLHCERQQTADSMVESTKVLRSFCKIQEGGRVSSQTSLGPRTAPVKMGHGGVDPSGYGSSVQPQARRT